LAGTYGILNEQGQKSYPGIFSKGRVPLQSIFMTESLLCDQGKEITSEIYRIAVDKLSLEQIEAIIAIVAKSNNLSTRLVRLSFDQLGFIPIKTCFIATLGTDQLISQDDIENINDEDLSKLEIIDTDPTNGLGIK